jgi:hypothetical protein
MVRGQGPYSQHLSFFAAYKLTQKAGLLHYSWLEMLVRDKYSSLLDPFVSYIKNEVL